MDDNQSVAKLIVLLAEIYGEAMSPSRLKGYLISLEDISVDEMQLAFNFFTKESQDKRLPLPAAIRAAARPQLSTKQQAIRILDHIEEAISKHGSYSGAAAKEALGEHIWDIVQRIGGWSALCSGSRLRDAQGYAQTRDQIEAMVTSQRKGISYEALPAPETPAQIEGRKKVLALVDSAVKDIK